MSSAFILRHSSCLKHSVHAAIQLVPFRFLTDSINGMFPLKIFDNMHQDTFQLTTPMVTEQLPL